MMIDFVLVITGGCALFSIFLPFVARESSEARRMLTFVKSSRIDVRAIPMRERFLSKIIAIASHVEGKLRPSRSSSQEEAFSAAGFRHPRARQIFFAARIASVLVGLCVGALNPDHGIALACIAALLGSAAPKMWLLRKQKTRRERIRRSIPDVIDLLVISVEAGLGMEQAVLRIGQELTISHPDMAEELERVTLERQAGSPRIATWKSFSERVCLKDLTDFVNLLTETERFGTPITKALSEFSDQLRTKRRQNAEEAAAKLKVKIIFPLVLCIFPCTFVVLLGPALLNLARSFGSIAR